MAWMARFSPRFARGGSRRTVVRLLVRRVRRWGSIGGRGVLLETCLQRVYTRAELCQFVLERMHIGLDRCGSVLPVLWHKGEWPAGVSGLKQRFHDISRRHTTRSDCWTVYSGKRRPSPEENA